MHFGSKLSRLMKLHATAGDAAGILLTDPHKRVILQAHTSDFN